MALAITVTVQDVYPPRNLVAVTGLTVGNSVQLFRIVNGQRELLRGGIDDSIADVAFIRADAEFPFGVPVTYQALINGTTTVSTGATTYSLASGKPVLQDVTTGEAQEVVVVAWDEKTRSRNANVFVVAGQNIVRSGRRGQFVADIELFLEAGTSVSNFNDLLSNTTENILFFRNDLGERYYIAVLSDVERRYSQDRTDERRFFVLNVAEVSPWADVFSTANFTYQDVMDYYGVSATYATVMADFATYLAALQGDFS